MINGIKLQAKPTPEQAIVLAQWMGCARFIWNAKCSEDKYLRSFARKYLPIGTFPEVDQKYSQYKDKDLSPWLSNCPSQVLRNSSTNWYNTYQKFLKGVCGRPNFKKKSNQGSVHLTRELFQLVERDGKWKLTIGTRKNMIGELWVRFHRSFEMPSSIYVRHNHGRWSVSFCYDDGIDNDYSREDHLKHLRGESESSLQSKVIGIDRGVVRPVQFGEQEISFTPDQKRKIKGHERHLRQLQRKFARQEKASNRRSKTGARIAKKKRQQGNIRQDFCHKASRTMVDSKKSVLVFENLATRNMTKSSKGTTDSPGKQVKQKSGLNRSILAVGWHMIQTFTEYKAERSGKAVFYISPHQTSQECANCGHIHADNRASQPLFKCIRCDHADNADNNASSVIKKRAIKLILDSGTELDKKGVLKPRKSIGRGAPRKTNLRKKTSQLATKRQQKTIRQAA